MRFMRDLWRVSLAAVLALGVTACTGGANEVLEPEDEETAFDGEGKAEADHHGPDIGFSFLGIRVQGFSVLRV